MLASLREIEILFFPLKINTKNSRESYGVAFAFLSQNPNVTRIDRSRLPPTDLPTYLGLQTSDNSYWVSQETQLQPPYQASCTLLNLYNFFFHG